MLLRRIYEQLSEGRRQFLKFSFVGGIGFVADAGTLWLMTHYGGLDPWSAGLVSTFVFGMTTTWLLNRFFTFRDLRSRNFVVEYLRFASANIVGNLLSLGAFSLLVVTVPLFYRYPVIAKAVGVGVGLIVNFTGSKYFVFRPSKAEPEA